MILDYESHDQYHRIYDSNVNYNLLCVQYLTLLIKLYVIQARLTFFLLAITKDDSMFMRGETLH